MSRKDELRPARLLDRDNCFVSWMSIEEAETMIRSGKATRVKDGKRPVLRIASAMRLQDFKGCDPAKDKTFYSEHHAGHELVVLKRIHSDGTMHRWDNDLTFEELRTGKTRSRALQLEQRVAASVTESPRKPAASEYGHSMLPEAA